MDNFMDKYGFIRFLAGLDRYIIMDESILTSEIS
jgi:hypothetical protein